LDSRDRNFNVTLVGASLYAADFDEDGVVDRDDLLRWSANMGLSAGALHTQGDANADGTVNGNGLSRVATATG
jgi:hypothetical protein